MAEATVGESLACAAGGRFVPEWAGMHVEAYSIGGTSRTVFKIVCRERPGEVYCARVFQDRLSSQIVIPASRLLAAQGLAPAVIGADHEAIVQEFVRNGNLETSSLVQLNAAARFGNFAAVLHSIPIETNAVEAPKARPADLLDYAQAALQNWDHPDFNYEEIRFDLALLEEQLPHRLGGTFATKMVWTHGDFHPSNILESAVGKDSKLQVVDLMLIGPRPATTDIAYFFVTSGFFFQKHPPLEWRQTFARAYLETSNVAQDEASVQELLWAVECETPYQFAWLILVWFGLARATANAPREKVRGLRELWALVALFRSSIVDAKNDEARRHDIIQHGAVAAQLGRLFPIRMYIRQNCCHVL